MKKLVRENINESIPFVKTTPVKDYIKETNSSLYNVFFNSIDLISKAYNKNKDLLEKYNVYPVNDFIDSLNIICNRKDVYNKKDEDILYYFINTLGNNILANIIGKGTLSYLVLNNYFIQFLERFEPTITQWIGGKFSNINLDVDGINFDFKKHNKELYELANEECKRINTLYSNKVYYFGDSDLSKNYYYLGISTKIIK